MNKTIKLSVLERIHLLNNLPKKGSIIESKILRGIFEKIEFNQKEIKDYGLKDENGKISWVMEKAKDKDITFNESEIDIIKRMFKELDSRKEFNVGLIELYEKFEK